jgi:hypothetical protein
MAKPVILYELEALVRDDLTRETAGLAEALGREEAEVTSAIVATKDRYDRGEISQSQHWGETALKLALDDVELLSAFAIKGAEVDRELLGRIRAQSPVMTLGLVSEATPDFVGYFRQTYQLDDLIHVHVIGSELDEERDYRGLLELSADRLQAKPARIHFVDRKAVHLKVAADLGFREIDLSNDPDLKAAFAELG